MTKPVPHDVEAEQAIIGAMLQLSDSIGELVDVIDPSDFYDPRCREAFEVLAGAYSVGKPFDMLALRDALKTRGYMPTPKWWSSVMECASAAYITHAQTVVEHRARRDALAVLGEALADVYEGDPLVIRDRVCKDLGQLVGAIPESPPGLYTVEEVLRSDVQPDPWVVPGLLRRGWRCIIVAGEGIGKSELLRQFALATSQGLHPLGFLRMPHHVRVLLVDLENSLSGVKRSMQRMWRHIPSGEWVDGNLTIWSRPGGIDLRSRVGRAQLDAAIMAAQPALLLIGPAYKMYRRHGDSDEDAVADVQQILDDFRTRYGMSVLLEHHAPHGHQGVRDMRPVGSSWWLRWPEFGFGLVPVDPNSLQSMTMHRWRGDREENYWPASIDRGVAWPWEGRWSDEKWRELLTDPDTIL